MIIDYRNNCLGAGSSDIPFIEIKREIRNLRSNRMALETEDLSDSGTEKPDVMSSIAVPNSPRVPPEGAEMDIQIDQLRPHNQQQYSREDGKQLSVNIQSENKCQASQSATNSTANVSFIDINIDDPMRSSCNRLSPRGGADSSSQSINQHNHIPIPFSNTTYAAFKKGNVVRGILCPSLTNSFR